MKRRYFLSFFLLGKNILAQTFVNPSASCLEKSIADLVKEVAFKNDNSLMELLEYNVQSGNLLFPILLVLLAGFLTSLSPCIYPLIPITLSVMGARDYTSRLQGFLVSLSYVAGMSIVYCALGIAFASFGILAGSIMQNSFTLILLSFFLIAMAFSMWGIIDINLPPALSKKLSKVGKKGFKGAFLMGLAAGLIAAPCTGPVLGFILALIAKGQNIFFACLLMLFFSLGLGILFLILGTFSSSITFLPKSGRWMSVVKYFFGSIILSAAFYYISLVFFDVNDIFISIKKLGIALTLSFLFLFLLLGLFLSLKNFKYVFLIHVSYALMAVFLTVCFRWSSLNDLDEIKKDPITWHVVDHQTQSFAQFEHYLNEAKEKCQNVMIDFYADWCVACRELENTFHDKRVKEVLKSFYLIRIDATNNSKLISLIERKYGIVGLPTLIFLDKNLNELTNLRNTGFIRADDLLGRLSRQN